MSDKKNYWTIKSGKQWSVIREGNSKPSSHYSSKQDAWYETRRLARGAGGEAILKDQNGKTITKNIYDQDLRFPGE